MSKYNYYGETVALISKQLHQNQTDLSKIEKVLQEKHLETETTWTLCAQAGTVFHQIEDVCGDHFMDWDEATRLYARKIHSYLLNGRIPNAIDFCSMAIHSIQKGL